MTEEWKDIEGFPGYRVSNSGRVWGIRYNKILIPQVYKPPFGPYHYVNLYRDKRCIKMKVHRLVATHFIPNPENKPTVNHKDKVLSNNCISNLEWATMMEQNTHRNLTYKCPEGVHSKPLTLEKDGVEYPFKSTTGVANFLKIGGRQMKQLKSGESIKGFKIKNVAGV